MNARAILLLTAMCTQMALAADPAEFRARIDERLSADGLRQAIWGVRIEAADGTVLYDRNSATLLAPASNRKLAVAAFAADCLGIDRRLETRLLTTGAIRNGRLEGDLVIAGDGDPSLGGRYDLHRNDVFGPLLAALRTRGVREIGGGVVADVSLFADEPIPGSWKSDNLGEDYAAPVDAIAWNENVIGFRVEATGTCPQPGVLVTSDPAFVPMSANVRCADDESFVRYRSDEDNRLHVTVAGPPRSFPDTFRDLAAVDNPALYAAQALTQVLLDAGIRVSAGPRVSREPVPGEVISTILSPPVGMLLATVLEPSQNLYAEMLLKRAAAEVHDGPVTYDEAVDAEEDFLASIGVARDEVRFLDGSGLSPDDLITNRGLITIVRWMAHPAREGYFRQVLPRPRGEGTLRNRLAGYETRIAAKTGTINTVAALSGWADTLRGERRFFSIIVNHHTTSSSQVREAIDAIAAMAADL